MSVISRMTNSSRALNISFTNSYLKTRCWKVWGDEGQSSGSRWKRRELNKEEEMFRGWILCSFKAGELVHGCVWALSLLFVQVLLLLQFPLCFLQELLLQILHLYRQFLVFCFAGYLPSLSWWTSKSGFSSRSAHFWLLSFGATLVLLSRVTWIVTIHRLGAAPLILSSFSGWTSLSFSAQLNRFNTTNHFIWFKLKANFLVGC